MVTSGRCPICESLTVTDERGDLDSYFCEKCGWRNDTMVARVFPEMARSIPVFVVVRTNSPVSAEAMMKIRAVSPLVAAVPLGELQQHLCSSAGLDLGTQAEYRAKELVSLLEPLGFAVKIVPISPNK